MLTNSFSRVLARIVVRWCMNSSSTSVQLPLSFSPGMVAREWGQTVADYVVNVQDVLLDPRPIDDLRS